MCNTKGIMNAEQLSKIKMRSGIGGASEGPSTHEQTIDRCMFEYKVLAMLRHVVEQATKHASVACRCRNANDVEDVDMVLALKYVAVTWIDTPEIESKIKQYYEQEVSHGEKSLSFWFANVREKDEDGADDSEEKECDGDNKDEDQARDGEEDSESESEWESMTSEEIAELGDIDTVGGAVCSEYAKVDTREIRAEASNEDMALYAKMQETASGWDEWFPRDGISQILKNAVQASINKCLKH